YWLVFVFAGPLPPRGRGLPASGTAGAIPSGNTGQKPTAKSCYFFPSASFNWFVMRRAVRSSPDGEPSLGKSYADQRTTRLRGSTRKMVPRKGPPGGSSRTEVRGRSAIAVALAAG